MADDGWAAPGGKDAAVVEVPQQRDLPARKVLAALLAISFGTIIEWYDYSIYTQLSKTLGKVFFPSNDPALQALSFWGVYAVGFLSRPAGALLFGHIGDSRGRGMCLLISVCVMGIPTVLIGCLPTYAQAGFASPCIMAVLRLVQGVGMGGEFAASMVALYELAASRHKGAVSSVSYISLALGVMLGIVVVNAVLIGVPSEAALLAWGWRVPFLVASLSLVAAVVMRYNMAAAESAEFAASHEAMDAQYRARVKQQHRQHLQHGQLPQPQQQALAEAGAPGVDDADDEVVEREVAAKHYTPVLELLRGCWCGLLLHTLYASWNAAAFHFGYSWLPSFFVQQIGISSRLSLWMLLSCMALFTAVVPLAGVLSDRGLPRMTTNIVIAFTCGAAYVPTFMGFATRSVAACWVLQALHLALVGWAVGVLPVIVSRIYPAGVRITGVSVGHNFAATIGGLTPLCITAIQAATQSSQFLGPALFMTGMACSSIAASLLLIKRFPDTNRV